MKLRCWKQESANSEMFTEGELYEAKETGYSNCLYEIKDNFGRDHFIPKYSMNFCVENNSGPISVYGDNDGMFFAHFEAVDP